MNSLTEVAEAVHISGKKIIVDHEKGFVRIYSTIHGSEPKYWLKVSEQLQKLDTENRYFITEDNRNVFVYDTYTPEGFLFWRCISSMKELEKIKDLLNFHVDVARRLNNILKHKRNKET